MCSEASNWGKRVTLAPSRFIDELPATELQRDGADPEADAERKQERARSAMADLRAMLNGD